mmetsp:Transcript_11864/g.11787  ORF Transcript_11864/g.11787 Transcript_11864/m.11787 type:complete len:81 (+) Transcript_11864:860-1102(+)
MINTLANEPYTSPGDYNVPHLVGSQGIIYSHIKTPPGYSFSKSSLKERVAQIIHNKSNQASQQNLQNPFNSSKHKFVDMS